MAGSTTASTTSFNSKKGPSTVPVRRNGVKIGPATLNEVKQNIKTKATAPLKDFVPRSSHQPSSILLAFSQPSIGVKKVCFQQTYNQGLRQLLLTVSWDLRA